MATSASTERKKSRNKKFTKTYFDVLGLCCPSEVPLIERALKDVDGISDFKIIVPSRTVIVFHDPSIISQEHIVKALNQARLEASVRVQGAKNFDKRWPSPCTIICGVLLLLSLLRYTYDPLKWIAMGAVAVGIVPVVLRAVTAIRNFSFGDVNILVIIAENSSVGVSVAGSIILKDYWEAGTIVFLFTIAEWLETRASHKATATMSSLVNLVPQKAILAETGEEVSVDVVRENTLLAVKDGEVVPIDGIVVEGNCEVDEKTLTGESFPVPKQKDSTVWAGTINVNGYITFRTTAPAEDSVVARMTKLVEDSQNNRSKTQRYIDKCAKYYTPGIVIISALLAIVPAALRLKNEKYWFHLALVVLVSACPCALVLSTPVAMFCALIKAATSGIFFKGAQYFEILARVKIMAFDKTGTITRAEFEVTEFKALLDDIDMNTLLYWVSSIESKSSHPMAAALISHAQLNSVEPKPDSVEEFQNFPGEGIYGKIDGKEIYIGNRKIGSRSGCKSIPKLEGNFVEGMSIGYIYLDSTPAGVFCLSDVCRTGAKEALEQLRSMGIKTAMLTGDSSAAANYAQQQVGGALKEVHAELLPEDKVKWIKEFQKNAPTAMIGDGLNDAPALSNADVGISMGISGSALASETGNVILMTNDIQKIPKIAHLARRVRRKIIENMFLSIITKAAIVALAIAGHPLVWAAVLADTGTCLLVIANSMLLMRGGGSAHRAASPHKHKAKPQTCSSKNCGTSCKSSSNSLEVESKKLHDTKHSCGDHHEHAHGLNHRHGHHHHDHHHYDDHDHKHDHDHEHEFDHDHHHDDDDDEHELGHAHEELNLASSSEGKSIGHEYEMKHCEGDNEDHHHKSDLEMGSAVEFCCQLLESNTPSDSNMFKGGCRNRKCSNWKNRATLSDVNIFKGGCRNRKCSNLKNRSVRACCRGFMECSANNSGLRNGYSEIVTE